MTLAQMISAMGASPALGDTKKLSVEDAASLKASVSRKRDLWIKKVFES